MGQMLRIIDKTETVFEFVHFLPQLVCAGSLVLKLLNHFNGCVHFEHNVHFL
jgi:hypothetical protein